MKSSTLFHAPRHAKLAAPLAALLLSFGAQAATPASWWIDVINDRATNVRDELARGADPNAVNDEDLPTLMLAIRSGAWQVYDALVAHRGTQIEVENKHGETPLMYLALLGETDRAVDLIEKGAQVNRLGWTPLHYAASRGQSETARMLIERGAIIHAPAPDGTTPLMMAAYSGDRDTVQLLLDKGADATAININKHTAADWARERRHTALADDLEAVAKRTRDRREGRTAPEQMITPDSENRKPESSTGKYFNLDRFNTED